MSDEQQGENGDKPQVEFIDNPNPLKDKVKLRPGGDARKKIARADKVVGLMADEFEEIFKKNTVRLAGTMKKLLEDKDGRAEHVARVRYLLNELRGQAGTFGYPLVSQVGDSCCKFIDLSSSVEEGEIEVVEVHVNALIAINQAKIKGDGGPVGNELIAGLRKVIIKYNNNKTK